MLNWVQRFNIFCLLDNNSYNFRPNDYEYLLGAGSKAFISDAVASFDSVDTFLQGKQWTFGHIAYDLGYSFQNLNPEKDNRLSFPQFFFFQPQIVLFIQGAQLHIECSNADEIYDEIMNSAEQTDTGFLNIPIQQKLTKRDYLQKIRALQAHIQRGDCYEINFCQEFFAEDVVIHPVAVFHALNVISPNPFAALYKIDDRFLICASPERFLNKNGNKLLSQPMKGTAKRVPGDEIADKQAFTDLGHSAKDRAENVMVVDMVRNDLSVICKEGTVQAEALFEVHSFPAVHQMVSAITGLVEDDVPFSKIIRATFPMGSMTGAPKKRVMQLIDKYEEGSRGIFSGTVGCITPTGNFDFNVVIRSIIYNATNRYLSYQVGSGITIYSDPEKEWEECLLKGEGIKKVLTSASTFV